MPFAEVWADVPTILRGEPTGLERSTVWVITGETAIMPVVVVHAVMEGRESNVTGRAIGPLVG